MRKVIEFIMSMKLEFVEELPTLIKPINENFSISTHDGKITGYEAAKMLMDEVVYWETHSEIYDSLETILNNKFKLIENGTNN